MEFLPTARDEIESVGGNYRAVVTLDWPMVTQGVGSTVCKRLEILGVARDEREPLLPGACRLWGTGIVYCSDTTMGFYTGL